ncbi:MAG: cupin domain-containing protein [Bacteroidota bacterium]|nr:cupin domain-containing protein [Bacteroidota bacterium]
MKTIKMASLSLVLGLFVMLSAIVYAQDAAKLAPTVSQKVILDNEKVRVIAVEFEPGATTDWHSHPNHVVYALTDGKMEITVKGKPANVVDLKAGTAMYLPSVTHMAKNIGTATVKMVVTELKPAPAEKK